MIRVQILVAAATTRRPAEIRPAPAAAKEAVSRSQNSRGAVRSRALSTMTMLRSIMPKWMAATLSNRERRCRAVRPRVMRWKRVSGAVSTAATLTECNEVNLVLTSP